MNILLTCAGRRRYLVDYFKQSLDGKGLVIGTDMSPTAPALEICDRWHLVPNVYDPKYIEILLDICRKEKIAAVISLNDLELPILARHRMEFRSVGAEVVVSNVEAIRLCSDKWATVQLAKELDIPTPATFLDVPSVNEALENGEIRYPLIVKPRWGSASFGLFVAEDAEELPLLFNLCTKRVKSSYLSQFAESDDVVIVQEFISGQEYGLDIFNDLDGRYCGVVCKRKLAMRGGETDKATTVSSERFADHAQRLANRLGHIGNLDCDFLEDERGLFLLELNPRFGGGYPFSHEAGARLTDILLQCLSGQAENITIQYKENMTFSKCDILVPSREG